MNKVIEKSEVKKGQGLLEKFQSKSGIQLGTLLALILMCIVLVALTMTENGPKFVQPANVMNIFKQTAVNAFISVGMLLCLMTAGIDLSVGANAIFCSCVVGALAKAGFQNGPLLILVALAIGAIVGCSNGLLLTRLHLPHPFVSTLGVKNVLWGLALLVTNSQMISNCFPDEVQWLGHECIGGVSGFPISFIFVIIVYVIMHIFLSRTSLGRSIYCAGGNIEATRLSGINTANVLTFCYTISGIMAAIAGVVIIGRTGICNGANATQPYDTDAIAACIIGGASFNGGKGTMGGTMIGCLIIAILRNGFSLLAIPSSVQNIVLGLIIILSVLMDVVRAEMEKKRRMQAAAKAAGVVKA